MNPVEAILVDADALPDAQVVLDAHNRGHFLGEDLDSARLNYEALLPSLTDPIARFLIRQILHYMEEGDAVGIALVIAQCQRMQ